MASKTTKVREAYRAEHDRCQADDDCPYAACVVHEIARGIHRQEAMKHRCALLALCSVHHEKMHDPSLWPIERQLARKMLVDPDHFDLEKICEIRDRAPTAIVLSDIVKYLQLRGLFE